MRRTYARCEIEIKDLATQDVVTASGESSNPFKKEWINFDKLDDNLGGMGNENS